MVDQRIERGRAAFTLRSRMGPIGLPLAGAVAFVTWTRTRSASRAAGAALLALGLTAAAAQLDFEIRRAGYRRWQLEERRRRRESWREQTGT
jgi:hypothetical protein